jgi:protein-S-isoprenylcysteine O-methyltransferase Ste14
MPVYILAAGLLSAAPLVILLVATLVDARLGIWPTPVKGTWQSLVFWSLFRVLNTSTLALAALGSDGFLGLAQALKWLGLAIGLAFGVVYACTLIALGRTNTYCRRGGLVTDGIYRWTRNPQYAAVIAAFGGLAVAADSAGVYLLSAGLIAVYVLMAHAEEPWLRREYGGAYGAYVRSVPRFFNFRRAWLLVRAMRVAPARVGRHGARSAQPYTHKR